METTQRYRSQRGNTHQASYTARYTPTDGRQTTARTAACGMACRHVQGKHRRPERGAEEDRKPRQRNRARQRAQARLCQMSRLDWPDERVQLVKVAGCPHDVHAHSSQDDAQLAKPVRQNAYVKETPGCGSAKSRRGDDSRAHKLSSTEGARKAPPPDHTTKKSQTSTDREQWRNGRNRTGKRNHEHKVTVDTHREGNTQPTHQNPDATSQGRDESTANR